MLVRLWTKFGAVFLAHPVFATAFLNMSNGINQLGLH